MKKWLLTRMDFKKLFEEMKARIKENDGSLFI
jgi:hypothetical protein